MLKAVKMNKHHIQMSGTVDITKLKSKREEEKTTNAIASNNLIIWTSTINTFLCDIWAVAHLLSSGDRTLVCTKYVQMTCGRVYEIR